jgi:ribonuclease P protein component
LTQRRQFQAAYRGGRRAGSHSFTLFALPNELEHCRLGITVTRKIGGAVKRNRAKRQLRDIFRRHRAELRPCLDLVIHARPPIVERTRAQLEQEFLRGFARLAVEVRR